VAELGLLGALAGKAAALAFTAAVSVSTTEPPGNTVAGEDVAVMPVGRPDMLTVIAVWPVPPTATERVCVLPG